MNEAAFWWLYHCPFPAVRKVDATWLGPGYLAGSFSQLQPRVSLCSQARLSPVCSAPLIFSWEPPQLNNQEQPAGNLAASTPCWGCKQAPRTSQEPPCLPPNDRCFYCHRSEVTDPSRSVSYLTAHCQGCLLAFGTVLHFPCLLCQGPAQSSRQSLAPW